jgi:hypothetical protein
MDHPLRPSDRSRRSSTNDFARALDELGRRYNGALLVVENNTAAGGAVATRLRDTHHYPALYTEPGVEIPGVRTTPKAKSAYVAQMKADLDDEMLRTPDERITRDMTNFIITERNSSSGYEKMAARAGTHDDLMMALLIANAHRRQALTIATRGATVIPAY